MESKTYTFPTMQSGAHTLTVRVLFRPFQPHFLKALEADPVTALQPGLFELVPTYEMATATEAVVVP